MIVNAPTYRKTQKGAALLVAIVMVFLLSVMGISSLRNASMEMRMVSNSAQARDVFQAADSSNEIVLNNNQNLMDSYNAADRVMAYDTNIRQSIGLRSQVMLRFVGEGNAVGASLNAMQGANSFDALRFVAEGVATIDAVSASRRIDQGVTRTVPSN